MEGGGREGGCASLLQAPATWLLCLEEKPLHVPFATPRALNGSTWLPAGVHLGGWGSVRLIVTGDWDAAVTAARLVAPADLWAVQGQEAIGGQRASDRRLVHVGGEAVAAVELTRDVTMVIL